MGRFQCVPTCEKYLVIRRLKARACSIVCYFFFAFCGVDIAASPPPTLPSPPCAFSVPGERNATPWRPPGSPSRTASAALATPPSPSPSPVRTKPHPSARRTGSRGDEERLTGAFKVCERETGGRRESLDSGRAYGKWMAGPRSGSRLR